MPSNVEGKLNPLHELVLVGLGMSLLDNLDLEAWRPKRGSGTVGNSSSWVRLCAFQEEPDPR